MQPFKIPLSEDKVVTGLHSLPSAASTSSKSRPLIIALHGGTYTAKYFDVNANHTASFASNALGVPFVAINRLGYHASTPFSSPPNGSSYAEEYGLWLHQHVLPALWMEFGEPNGCNCTILHAHSLGSTGAIIAASLHATDTTKAYPLAGISLSGFGSQPAGPQYSPPQDPSAPPNTVLFPPEVKDTIMLQPGHGEPELYKHTQELNHPMPVEEIGCIASVWFPRWKEWAGTVTVPVMVGISGHDLMWKGTEEHLRDFTSAFTRSERVDGSVVTGAPHNMELSYWAKGWYTRCIGFALECAARFAQKQEQLDVGF